jgi:hypothetical protein
MAPGVDNVIPEGITLQQNLAKPDSPTKHVMAALELRIDPRR